MQRRPFLHLLNEEVSLTDEELTTITEVDFGDTVALVVTQFTTMGDFAFFSLIIPPRCSLTPLEDIHDTAKQ